MLRIVSHIERLLLTHDCVIIPRMGGFVLQDGPAVFADGQSRLLPAHKEIVFNSTLQHNDGLLPESYMKAYGVDYAQASLMVDDDIREWEQALSHRPLRFGGLGAFRLSDDGGLVFESDGGGVFRAASYGLADLELVPWSALQQAVAAGGESPVGRSKDVVYIPVSKRFLRTAVASAAAVTLFLLISTPVKDVDSDAYTASFVPTTVVKSPVLPAAAPEAVAEIDASQDFYAEAASGEARPATRSGGSAIGNGPAGGSDVPEAEPGSEVKAAPLRPAVVKPVAVAPVRSSQKWYHVIIGSFPTRKQADVFLGRVDKAQFAGSGIVERDGKVRIYAGKFSSRSEAEAFLEQVRKQAVYKDAWLFVSR